MRVFRRVFGYIVGIVVDVKMVDKIIKNYVNRGKIH